jgi:hypothetical protein
VRLAFEVSRSRKTFRCGSPTCVDVPGRKLPWSSPGLQGLARSGDGEVFVSMPVLRRSGSLDFPAPSLTLRVAARVFEVFRRCHAGPWLLAKSRVPCGPSGLGSPSERVAFQSGSDRTDLLPWPWSRRTVGVEPATCIADPPSSGSVPPLHRPCRASTPASVAACFGHGESLLRDPVPSSWFCTTPMVSSARRLRACCIPLPVMRFAVFPARRPSDSVLPKQPGLGAAGHFPRRCSYPSKNSPRLQPFHIAVAVAPLPFRPSCSTPSPGSVAGSGSRSFVGRRVDFEAFLRCRVRSAVTTVAGRGAPYPSVGFVPLQGTFSESGAPRPRSSRRVSRWSPKRPAMRDELRSIPQHARACRGPGPSPRGDVPGAPIGRPTRAFAEANAAILADVWGLAPTIDCCFHSRRPEVVAVDPIPPQVRSLQSLSGAEVRAACARWCPGFPAHVSGRQHRPSWGS